MFQFLLKKSLVALFVIGLFVPARAQYHIPLDSVAKITFSHIAPFWNYDGEYRIIEVANEHGSWRSYRTELHIQQILRPRVDNFDRVFLKDISRKDVFGLFKSISKRDTGINPALFNIDKKRLLAEVDSFYLRSWRSPLRPKQRAAFAKTVNTKSRLDSMVTYVIRNSVAHQSDINSYAFVITTKGNKTYNVTASASTTIYGHLPWHIGNIIRYDPAISRFFDLVTVGKSNYYEEKELYRSIAFELYMKYFRTRISLENLRDDFPLAYKSLTRSFSAVSMIPYLPYGRNTPVPANDLVYNGIFHSDRLPKYVDLQFGFKASDTASLNERKRFLDTMVQHFSSKTGLFDRLLNQSDAKILIRQGSMAKYGADIFASFQANFPGLKNYDYKKSLLVRVRKNFDTLSQWILLPDNTVLLCQYLPDDKKLQPNDIHFMGLDDELIRKHYKHSYGVCLHLDASGKLIQDYGEVAEPYFGSDSF